MKTTIKVLLLSLAAAYPGVVLAGTTTSDLASVLTAQNALILYVIVGFGFLIAADYSRSSRMLYGSTKSRTPINDRAAVAPAPRVNAYSIHRKVRRNKPVCVNA